MPQSGDTSVEKIWYLSHIGLPERVGTPDLQRLVDASEVTAYRGGEMILGPHAEHDQVYFVRSGEVKISAGGGEGTAQPLALLEPGDLFGSLPLSDPGPEGQAEATVPSVVCRLHRTAFANVVQTTPEIALRVIHVLAGRLQAAEDEMAAAAPLRAAERLATLLLRLADEYGEPRDAATCVPLRLSHQDLAQMVGSTRETVAMLMGRFRADGIIAVRRRMLVVLNRRQLRALANAVPRG